jgi:Spy/CpxP family protein refolding chaperone
MAAILIGGGQSLMRAQAQDSADAAIQRVRFGEGLEKIREKLELTDDQIAQMREVVVAEKETLKNLLSRFQQNRGALRKLVQSANATESAIRNAAAKVASVEADLAVERHKLYSKLSPILTQEQRDKLKEFQDKVDDFFDLALLRLGQKAEQ